MQNTIKRGRVLREILKQDQLSPVPVEFHMAWLVGFNDGLFDDIDGEKITGLLQELQIHVHDSGLTLDLDRERWSLEVKSFLQDKTGQKV